MSSEDSTLLENISDKVTVKSIDPTMKPDEFNSETDNKEKSKININKILHNKFFKLIMYGLVVIVLIVISICIYKKFTSSNTTEKEELQENFDSAYKNENIKLKQQLVQKVKELDSAKQIILDLSKKINDLSKVEEPKVQAKPKVTEDRINSDIENAFNGKKAEIDIIEDSPNETQKVISRQEYKEMKKSLDKSKDGIAFDADLEHSADKDELIMDAIISSGNIKE